MVTGLKFYTPLLFAPYGLYGAIFVTWLRIGFYDLRFGIVKSADWIIIA